MSVGDLKMFKYKLVVFKLSISILRFTLFFTAIIISKLWKQGKFNLAKVHF